MKIVQLDASHGGHDSGAVGNGLKEKDIALSVTLKIGKILKSHQVKVIHSRIKDEFIELSERANIANRAKADVFVSIHCNYFSDSKAQGIEVYSYPNSVKGKELSLSILNHMVDDKVYTLNRGIKTANFAVLRLTRMPAVLVELGFITNKEDAKLLKNKQDELALSVAKGVLGFLDIRFRGDEMQQGEAYIKSVQELVDLDIITSPDLWLNTTKITVNNVKSLVIKSAREIDDHVTDYNGAVNVLVEAKIISSPEVWGENDIKVKNAIPLIIKMAAYE